MKVYKYKNKSLTNKKNMKSKEKRGAKKPKKEKDI